LHPELLVPVKFYGPETQPVLVIYEFMYNNVNLETEFIEVPIEPGINETDTNTS